MSIDVPFSAACERNKEPILEIIQPYLKTRKSLLEIGSGNGQHAVYFANACPELIWQTSDQVSYLEGIQAQLTQANITNVLAPIELDVNQENWGVDRRLFDIVYTANTLHIMSESDVHAFFNKVSSVSNSQAMLIVYGPFKYGGEFTSDSNQEFDLSLRSRGVGSCIKEFEEINHLANKQGFKLLSDNKMPANNQCLIWQKVD